MSSLESALQLGVIYSGPIIKKDNENTALALSIAVLGGCSSNNETTALYDKCVDVGVAE